MTIERVSGVSDKQVNSTDKSQQIQGGDFAQLIMQIAMGNNEGSQEVVQMLSQNSVQDDDKNTAQFNQIAQLLAQLMIVQSANENVSGIDSFNNAGSSVNNYIVTGKAGQPSELISLFESISAAQGENAQSAGNLNVNAFDTIDDAQLESFLEFAKFLYESGENPASENSPVTVQGLSQIVQALKELSDVENKEELTDADKLNLLKNAISKGDVSVKKDTTLGDIIGKMSENYRIYGASKNVKAQSASDLTDTGEDKNSAVADSETKTDGAVNTIDYTRKANYPEQVKTDGTEEENAVFNQALDSVSRLIKSGKESYTAKLNPEGLGEILVKMSKDASGIVINIVASSKRTAEILNSHLGSLQESLTDLNAQVKPAEIAPAQESYRYRGFSSGEEQSFTGFDGQSQKQFQSGDGERYYRTQAEHEEENTGTRNVYYDGKINTTI